MIDDEELIKLINESEFLLEGLDKSFWRLIKLDTPEIWGNGGDRDSEYIWVVAIMGNRCVFFNNTTRHFNIGAYEQHGEVETYYSYEEKLTDLIPNIISSRFKIS
jgi:hypothetical protein